MVLRRMPGGGTASTPSTSLTIPLKNQSPSSSMNSRKGSNSSSSSTSFWGTASQPQPQHRTRGTTDAAAGGAAGRGTPVPSSHPQLQQHHHKSCLALPPSLLLRPRHNNGGGDGGSHSRAETSSTTMSRTSSNHHTNGGTSSNTSHGGKRQNNNKTNKNNTRRGLLMRRRPNSVASSDNNDDDDNVYHTDEDDYDDEDEPDQIGSGTGSRKALWSGGLSSTSLPSNRSSKNIKQQQYQSQHQQHRQGYVYGSSPTASNAAALEERVHQKLGGSRRYNNNAEFENTTQNNDSNLAYLLTPPPTEDRSERRRYETSLRNSPLQTNTNSNTASQPKIRRRGLYDGELEPEGVRGQEAVFSSPPSLPTASSLGNVVGGISPLKLLPLVTPPPSQRQTATTPTTVSNHTLRMNSIHSSSNMHSLADVSHESSSYEDASLAIAAAPAPPPPTRQPLPPHSSSRPKRAVDRMVQYHEQKRPTRLQIPSPSRVKKPAGQQQLHPRPSAVGLQQQQTQLPHVPTPRPTKQPPQQQQLPKRLSSDGESTCSDEDISYLISKEFVRSLSGGTNRSDGGTSREVVPPTKPKTTMPNVFASSAQASQRQDRPSNNETYSDDNDIPPIRSALSVKAAKAGRGLSIKNLPPLSSSSSRHDRKVPRGAMENGHATPTTDPLIAVDSGELDELKSIEQWQTTASIAVQEGDFATGLAAFTAVLQAQTQRYGARAPHAAVAAAYHNLGTVHAKRAAAVTASMGTPTSSSQSSNSAVQLEAIRQDRAAALECFQAAARCARDATPPGARAPHPNVAVSLVRVGFLLLQSKQYENAIVTFSEALRIRLAVYGTKHALSANLYNNLGVCCLHMGEFAQGLVHLEQALEIQRYLVAQDKEGQQDRPEEQNNRGAAAAADALVVHQLELADTLFNIGGLCLEWMRRQGPDSRRADQAVSSFEECYSIRSTVLGPTDPRTEQAGVLRTTANSLPRPRRILQLAPPKEKSEASFATASTSRWMNTTRNLITGNKVSAFNKETSESRSNRIINNQSISSGNHVVEPPAVKRSLQVNSPIFGENFPTSLSPIRFDKDFDDSNETTSIFRIGGINNHSPLRPTTLPSENSKNIHRSIDDQDAHQHTAPLLQISVSKEESEENFNDDDEEQRNTTGTRVYTAPYHVSPGVLENERTTRGLNDVSVDVVVNESSYEKDGFAVDSSNESRLRPHLSSSYDAEENCLISDSGVDSRIGRIHYPLAWNRAGIQSNAEQATPRSRDILLARPTTNSNSHQYKETIHNGKLERKNFVRVNSAASDKWGSETVNVSTGNKERDDILARARQMLLEHSSPDSKGNSFDEDNKTAAKTNKLILRKKTKAQTRTGNAVSDQEMIEEGIAPLGGSWGNNSSGSSQNICLMLKDPIQHLKEIHDEATKQLKIGNVVDAQRLFDVVLECQRHRHGHLHPDVAAALHNLGITHLRAHNHSEALKVFEEAARVRKGSLGKDHALVAVSLVKVGITLLLLHRFEEALWSFREALSVRKHSLGALHPSTARIYNNIGCVYVEFNEFKEARRAFEAALDIQRSALCQDVNNFPIMFATATTLCNLGYLYRYRDMHGKASAVLKEASALQETVLGTSHATVLSTIDNLADSCANAGNTKDALMYYNVVLGRFKAGTTTVGENTVLTDGGSILVKRQYRAEAVLLYKMSRVYRQQKDRNGQLNCLQLALHSIRNLHDSNEAVRAENGQRTDTLERRIHYDIRACREEMEKEGLKYL